MTTPTHRHSRISGTGSALPPQRLSNADLVARLAADGIESSDDWIVERTGIRARHFVDDTQNASDLAVEAARRALEAAQLTGADIDLIIVATSTPDMVFPSTATIVQRKLGILHGCPAFDVQAVCSGFVYALTVADAMVRAGSARNALVIGAEVFSRMRLSQIDLLINAYNARMVRKHDMLSQKDVEDILGLSAIGVIPADERIVVSQNKGIPVLSMHTKATRAFMTAARAFANPRVIPVDLNKEDPCIRQGKIYLGGKECEYEG